MSTKQNDIWLEQKKEEFENGDYKTREKVIRELSDAGFEEEVIALYEENCSDCLGTGEVDNFCFDSDSKQYVWDGSRLCHHVLIDRLEANANN